jgi:hypothetical protein
MLVHGSHCFSRAHSILKFKSLYFHTDRGPSSLVLAFADKANPIVYPQNHFKLLKHTETLVEIYKTSTTQIMAEMRSVWKFQSLYEI